MNITVRNEQPSDFADISRMHIENFNHDLEAKLIENLRTLPTYQPYFSQVITIDDKVVGHALVTPVMIANCKEETPAVILGPVSIDKRYQRQGLGKTMLNSFLKMLEEKGHDIVLVYGGDYYHQFGFNSAEYVFRPNPMPGHGILMRTTGAYKDKKIVGVIHYPWPFNPLINEWSR